MALGTVRIWIGLSAAIGVTACGGGGDDSASVDSASGQWAVIQGTVPGTLIEALGDNGARVAVYSQPGSQPGVHPFQMRIQAGIGWRLAMTTNPGTSDAVVTPIAFRDNQGNIRSRLVVGPGDQVDLGHVPLPTSRSEAADRDQDGDGVLDGPMLLDAVGARNPLTQVDADEDGVPDYDDPDRPYAYPDGLRDPLDHDADHVPNLYDRDYSPGTDDADHDGIPDRYDADPYNDDDANDYPEGDMDHDGYRDDDHDHDGFPDDDEHSEGSGDDHGYDSHDEGNRDPSSDGGRDPDIGGDDPHR